MLSPQVVYGTIVLMITNILVIQFLIPLSFCVLCFFDPPLGGFFLPYIVTEIVSLPSTWRVVDPSMDTCPTISLRVVVEQDVGCGDTIQGHSAINMVGWVGAMH